MLLAAAAIIAGLLLLLWSADRFVDGAAATAGHLGMPPLLIGMVIIGFGTSAPEMVVSAISALEGNPGLALGNAYGSNITNIALVLGVTAIISPIAVHSQILRKELPILIGITLFAIALIWDNQLSRLDAIASLAVFAVLMGWTIRQGLKQKSDELASEVAQEQAEHPMSLPAAFGWLLVGLALLVVSSRLLVWGAVEVAQFFGVSDLVIGLTVVAVGTSLPELASSIAATRKGEHDLALGNVIGSNLFNTLAVVGIAGSIQPLGTSPELFYRDAGTMLGLTLLLFLLAYGFRGPARINRAEGLLLFGGYIAYNSYLFYSVAH